MINKIYSKINPSVLLHVIYKNESELESVKETKRHVISEPDHFLQAMMLEMPEGSSSKPHMHNNHVKQTDQTHEALLVLKGAIELSIYDIDKSLVEKTILNEGDCYMIVNGGHCIKTLSDAQLFEFKNGPYYGPEKDKTEIS